MASSLSVDSNHSMNGSMDDTSARDKSQYEDEEASSSRLSVPFPFILSVNNIDVKKAGRMFVKVNDLDLYINPNQAKNCTDLAICISDFNGELLHMTKVNGFAALPLDRPNEIDSFTFAAKSGRVSAGYSADEWHNEFHPAEKQHHSHKPASKPTSKGSIVKLPFASISYLKLNISWKGKGMSVKNTEVAIKPFQGDASTPSKDLVNYYAGACLSRVPGFISNAEVLGFNVVDSAVSTWGGGGGGDIAGNEFLWYVCPWWKPGGNRCC